MVFERRRDNHAERFREDFARISSCRRPPFYWQESLFESLRAGQCPTEITVPTGLGKTGIMPVWLLALAWQIEHDSRRLTLPRRLVWVVDRRVVVDQATEEAEALAQQIARDQRLGSLLRSISLLGAKDAPLAVSTLRGERADNRAWSSDPSRPAIVVGTVDMVASRLPVFRPRRRAGAASASCGPVLPGCVAS